ncbi:hypothetical protein BSKO_05206 [Bryopsis sp. KO-2023]|nr:hypothetical protein BSKO_05206 [Bryopsis sp. KO-2023]
MNPAAPVTKIRFPEPPTPTRLQDLETLLTSSAEDLFGSPENPLLNLLDTNPTAGRRAPKNTNSRTVKHPYTSRRLRTTLIGPPLTRINHHGGRARGVAPRREFEASASDDTGRPGRFAFPFRAPECFQTGRKESDQKRSRSVRVFQYRPESPDSCVWFERLGNIER